MEEFYGGILYLGGKYNSGSENRRISLLQLPLCDVSNNVLRADLRIYLGSVGD